MYDLFVLIAAKNRASGAADDDYHIDLSCAECLLKFKLLLKADIRHFEYGITR